MPRSVSSLGAATVVLAGGLLGYLAARSPSAPAAQATSDRPAAAGEAQTCCSNAAVATPRSGLAAAAVASTFLRQAPATAAGKKPNILVIFGDDIGQSNVSAYTMGLMGYRTPTSTASPGRA